MKSYLVHYVWMFIACSPFLPPSCPRGKKGSCNKRRIQLGGGLLLNVMPQATEGSRTYHHRFASFASVKMHFQHTEWDTSEASIMKSRKFWMDDLFADCIRKRLIFIILIEYVINLCFHARLVCITDIECMRLTFNDTICLKNKVAHSWYFYAW